MTLQDKLCEIIHSLVNIPDIFDFGDAVLYGVKNYIAKHSLASDYYNLSKEAESLLIDKRFKDFDSFFMRGWLDKKRFTYEHPIPANVTCKLLKGSDRSLDSVKKILSAADCVTVITKQQDNLLFASFASKMPDEWTYPGSDPFIRYKHVGIELSSTKLKVKGSLKR